jgi:hypothetical protein
MKTSKIWKDEINQVQRKLADKIISEAKVCVGEAMLDVIQYLRESDAENLAASLVTYDEAVSLVNEIQRCCDVYDRRMN